MSKSRVFIACLLLGIVGTAALLIMPGCGGGSDAVTVAVIGLVFDDSSLDPVVGATVEIRNRTSDPSGTSGAFRVNNVPTGNAELTVTHASYRTLSTQVTIQGDPTDVGNLYLSPPFVSGRGNITGVIYDVATPVSGATVTAAGKTATSKGDGSFTIYNLNPGTVLVTAEAGAIVGQQNVTVMPDETSDSVAIQLSTAPPGPPVI